MQTSQELYREFIRYVARVRDTIREQIGTVLFDTTMTYNEFNDECYEVMYQKMKGQGEVPSKELLWEQINGLKQVCERCTRFFLHPRSNLDKKADVVTGAQIEKPFVDFFNSKGIEAFSANEEDMRLPDIGVKDKSGETVALLEIKYHNAPFIKARKYVSNTTDCYDGSLTLDIEKVKRQVLHTRERYPDAELIVVHWIDFPCIKCIMWDFLENVGSEVYERKYRAGDYVEGRKVGYTKKTYHYVRFLRDFASLIEHLIKISR